MNSPTLFRAMPLALPEPADSQLKRIYGVEPWMLAKDFKEFCKATDKLGNVEAYARERQQERKAAA